MAVGLSVNRTDIIVRAALEALKQVAEEQNFPDHRLEQMQFKIECHYDISYDCRILRMGWSDPESGYRRGMQVQIDENLESSPEYLAKEIMMSIEQINLRGELFYFKLHHHFPNRIENVRCSKDGRVTVVFKNGRSLSTDEADLDSTEFLATCGMIYDL
jgi:hypothetical protein